MRKDDLIRLRHMNDRMLILSIVKSIELSALRFKFLFFRRTLNVERLFKTLSPAICEFGISSL